MINSVKKINAAKFPKSSTSGWICFAGLISFIIALNSICKNRVGNDLGAVLSGIAYLLPIVILEWVVLKVYKKPSTGLNFILKKKVNVERVLLKLVGLYATLGLVALFYGLFPVYHTDYYNSYWVLTKYLLLIIVVGSIPYFFILDRYLVEPEESYWKVGMIITGNWSKINFNGLKNFFLGWLVKAFFLPLMFVGLSGNISYLSVYPFRLFIEQHNNRMIFDYAFTYMYTIDLVVVFVGYIMTLRIFDSHIRTVEPSFIGWFVALQCYQPFWGALSGQYFAYESGFYWWQWLANYPFIFIVWGSMILFLLTIYSWSSVFFGIRFSNLTNRGILTNGPYRLMRHPAYISKNLSWWLVSIPFISQAGFFPALQHCLLLLLVNFIYYLRAKTEERHLSQDPVYVQYANAINERGLFKFFSRFSFLRYNADKYIKKKMTGEKGLTDTGNELI
jgi:hypothetical protein